MYYLSWNPLTWLSEGLEKVGGAIVHAIRTLFYMLDTLLYQLVINLYNTFVLLCSSRLLDSEIMNEIAKRVGLLLGIIMVFMVTFSFIKLLLDPEKMTDNKNGAVGIIKKAFLVIIMLGSSQFVFDTLYRVQRVIIKENIIPTIIIPFAVDTENFGLLLSEEVFTSFYRVNSGLENNDEEIVLKCKGMVNRLKYSIYHYGNFEPGYICLNESVAISDEDENTGISDQEITIIDYNWLIATAVGIALIYFLFSYCVSVGVRTIQLSVLEIIAPMAIISYISPKDDTMFKKWCKIYISTYIDAFIRIGIINFAAFLIATILDGGDKWFFWQSVGNPTEPYTKGFLMVAMILALLTFAKKAPDLLKELFPSGASKLGFGVSSPKNFLSTLAGGEQIGNAAKRAYGATKVGLNTVQRNFRKNLGKTWDVFHDSSATTGDKAKWVARTTLGSLYSGLGGARRGIMTTDKSGRRSAIENAVSRTQSNQKLHDAGYGSSIPGLITKKGRKGFTNQVTDEVRGFFGKDQIIGDMVDASDAAIQGLQNRIRVQEERYTGPTIQKSKVRSNMYTITNPDGSQQINRATGDVYFTETQARAVNNDGVDIAELYGQLGKMKSKNSALNQRKNEQESKNN